MFTPVTLRYQLGQVKAVICVLMAQHKFGNKLLYYNKIQFVCKIMIILTDF